jgi:phytoene synthase
MSNDADAYCAEQVRRFDRERWLTTWFAPAAARPGLLALYAFNVEVARIRELVREPAAGFVRLQWWREAIEGIATARTRDHPVVAALAAAQARHGVPPGDFEAILTARESDLSDQPPADFAALQAYAAGTSGALTRLALGILGAPAATDVGTQIGIAWAITGLLRAVPVHAAQRRLFLPRDLLGQHAVDPETLFAGRPEGGLARVAEILVRRAAEYLAVARSGRTAVSRAAVPALLPATIADVHLRRIERARFALFDPRLQRPLGSTAARLVVEAVRGCY